AISFSDFADARKNGTIALGLINQSNGQFTFDWKYKKLVSPGPYGYSCLTELPGGNLGLLFEGSDEQKIEFMEIEIPSLME
ncbi:MAG: sialidase family protein, partial [Mucinivorans sp.]